MAAKDAKHLMENPSQSGNRSLAGKWFNWDLIFDDVSKGSDTACAGDVTSLSEQASKRHHPCVLLISEVFVMWDIVLLSISREIVLLNSAAAWRAVVTEMSLQDN